MAYFITNYFKTVKFKLPAFFTFSYLFFFGFAVNASVPFIKNGSFDFCPGVTINEMVNSYIANPRWDYFKATDGKYYVNVEGQIYYYEQLVDMLLQFRIYNSSDRFEVNAFEIQGEPQYEYMTDALLENMCNEVYY